MMLPIPEILSEERLRELLGRFPALRIGVVGDICLDAYWFADMTRARLSRETPHFARPVVREEYGPGAGANVAQNLKALGVGRVAVFSVIGEDRWEAQLRAELARHRIGMDGLISSPLRRTTTYVKPILVGYDSRQEDARLDFENSAPLPGGLESRLVAAVKGALPNLDALVVTDQMDEFGVVTWRVRDRLNELAAAYPAVCFVADSRARIGLFHGMALKPNRLEAAAAAGLEGRDLGLEDFQSIGLALSRAGGRPVFVTLGEEGALVCEGEKAVHIPAAPVRPPLDTVGAGDAFLAALAAGLAAGPRQGAEAAGAVPTEAAALANLAAAVTVEKLNQTGTASPAEIVKRYKKMGRG